MYSTSPATDMAVADPGGGGGGGGLRGLKTPPTSSPRPDQLGITELTYAELKNV